MNTKSKDEWYVQDDEYDVEAEPETIEVASDVPRNFKFVHIKTEEGELMKMKDDEDQVNLIETMPGTEREIPLNFGFVHLQNADGDDIMRYM